MFTAPQRVLAAKELKKYGQAYQVAEGIVFGFDWLGDRAIAIIDKEGHYVKARAEIVQNNRLMPEHPDQWELVDDAMALSIRCWVSDTALANIVCQPKLEVSSDGND